MFNGKTPMEAIQKCVIFHVKTQMCKNNTPAALQAALFLSVLALRAMFVLCSLISKNYKTV